MAAKKKRKSSSKRKMTEAQYRAAVRAGRIVPANYQAAVMADVDDEWNRAVRRQQGVGGLTSPDGVMGLAVGAVIGIVGALLWKASSDIAKKDA
jgi:hypothetical protein